MNGFEEIEIVCNLMVDRLDMHWMALSKAKCFLMVKAT